MAAVASDFIDSRCESLGPDLPLSSRERKGAFFVLLKHARDVATANL